MRPLPAPWQQRYDHNWLSPLVGLTKPISEVKTTISKHFGELHDPRQEGMVEHKLLDRVTIAVCGAQSWVDVELVWAQP